MNIEQIEVQLSTGVRAPLVIVAGTIFLLERLLDGPPRDRELVVQLRKACLTDGRFSAEFQQEMTDNGLASADGTVEPVVREVVRAAIRGEGNDLHLASPFTTAWDRAVSNLLISLDSVRAILPAEQANALIQASTNPMRHQTEPGTSDRPRSWLDYVKKRYHPDTGLPPPSSN